MPALAIVYPRTPAAEARGSTRELRADKECPLFGRAGERVDAAFRAHDLEPCRRHRSWARDSSFGEHQAIRAVRFNGAARGTDRADSTVTPRDEQDRSGASLRLADRSAARAAGDCE